MSENRARPIRFEILNLLLGNILLAVHAHIAAPMQFLQLHVMFSVVTAFCTNNSLYARSPDPFSLETEGLVCETK